MTSKIINMAERIKDAEDRLLESMFDAAPIADDGFSASVVRRVRRGLWLRRLAVPVAALIGGAIAIKPLTGVVTVVARLSSMVPPELVNSTITLIPQAQTIVLGAMVLAACLLGLRSLEE
ncbi:MAG: hypothetical protein WBM61_12180 [Woeseiaceae bacterium]